MRQFIEFIPIAFFVVVYFTTRDIYIATAALMAGTVGQVAYEYIRDRQVSRRTQVIFLIIMLAGAATLAFQDEMFIKWKPTIANWIFCGALIGSQLVFKDNLLKKIIGGHLQLPEHVWRNLGYGWSFGFFLAGALNLIVAYEFTTDFWVTYKLVGGIGITLIYMIITMIYLVKGGYIVREAGEQAEKPAKVD